MRSSPRLRLAFAAAAFIGWLGWLAYLVLLAPRPTVLSRPQFMAAAFAVVADLEAGQGGAGPAVRVAEVYGGDQTSGRPAPGATITVENLTSCQNWAGPARYIIPLVPRGAGYQVPGVPPSPGFDPSRKHAAPRVYPADAQTLAQLREIYPES